MSVLLPLLVALPLMAAAAALAALDRRPLQRGITLTALSLQLAMAVALAAGVLGGGPLAVQVGGWPAGYAIPLVADGLAAPLLVVMSLLALLCAGFAMLSGEDRGRQYLPLVLVVVGGVTGALLTADLFNLFVFFEVMLAGSYVLIGWRRGPIARSAVYIVTSLLASTLLLAGIALLYGSAGTLHLGLLHGAAAEDGAVALATVVILLALAVKSAAVPVHGWLPHAYSGAPPAIAALFSGLLTKVGVYALLRVSSILFDGQSMLGPVWATVAVVSMVVGVAGALGRNDISGILSFHMVSQIGYLLVVVALIDSPAAVVAGLFFFMQYILVKGGLFLVSGVIDRTEGSVRLDDLGGIARRDPALAAVFLVLALSLAGLPPLSGFVAKYLLAVAAFGAGAPVVGAAVVAVSLCTLLSMLKIWNQAFWGDATGDRAGGARERAARRPLAVPAGGSDDGFPWVERTAARRRHLLLPAAVLALATLLAGIGAAPAIGIAEVGAAHLLDPAAYVEVTS